MRLCSPQLGLSPQSILGGEVFDREILLGLSKKNVTIDLILPKNKPYDKNIVNFSITFLLIKSFPAILGNIIYIPYLLNINFVRKIHILRLHQPQFLFIAALVLKLVNKQVNIIATYHKFEETKFGYFSMKINNFWDHIIVDSNNVKKQLISSYNLHSSKITVVHNGVPRYLNPKDKDQKIVKKLNLKGKKVLLFMGSFDPRKNPLFLLKVLKKINDKNYVIIYWGSGPMKNEIISMANKLNIYKQIRLIVPIFGVGKNLYHNLTDIFVHPSIDEGFALAPLEAMACGKPILISDGYSSNEAVVDGKNGYILKMNNVDQWKNKIIELMSNKNLRRKYGSASHKKALDEFQWKYAVDKHYELIKSLS